MTALVQAVVRGDFDPNSRYTRVELIDEGGASRDSYKQIYSDEATNRPTAPDAQDHVRRGDIRRPPPGSTSTTTASGTTLRVLQWNTHHGGYGTDGKYDTNRLATWIVRDAARRRAC